LIQVPTNRYGDANHLELGQLKILQEVVTSHFPPSQRSLRTMGSLASAKLAQSQLSWIYLCLC
jgi:hypothetical protein